MCRVVVPISETNTVQAEVVCFVRAMETGKLEINYSHHCHRTRPTSSGAWDVPQYARLPLTPYLLGMIHTYVGMAMFEYFIGRTRVMPGPIGSPLEAVKW